ncbi:hypothetical protein TOPH_03590 [Tolypocladium ophioglossoides CBS 100239]|uniref:Uncharacterized protein n=1 Tax=Tolypocladium ophioglossoides (strain CBS 100239) TaxID=1163406 RepID=A0A0L0NDR3_TOLOC|nr:hypothetical protein TOPH_03590 [Tolypocladium ophioglossoides CBS 100239]
MPSQRPYLLSSFISAFRQQGPSLQTSQQPNKHTTQASASAATTSSTYAHQSAAAPRTVSTNATSSSRTNSRSPPAGVSVHSPRGTATATSGIPIPIPSGPRRRGSDSSSEGFRDALGADKWYIGGRTAGGEERFFKMGVVRRVRSNDGLSLDRLSL